MAVQAAIVLADGQATPVNKTFNPRGVNTTKTDKRYALWREQTAVNAGGYFILSELYTLPGATGVEKYLYTIEIPTLQTVGTNDAGFTPNPEKAYSTLARLEFVIPQRSTQQELKDIVAYTKNLASGAYMSNAILNRDPAW